MSTSALTSFLAACRHACIPPHHFHAQTQYAAAGLEGRKSLACCMVLHPVSARPNDGASIRCSCHQPPCYYFEEKSPSRMKSTSLLHDFRCYLSCWSATAVVESAICVPCTTGRQLQLRWQLTRQGLYLLLEGRHRSLHAWRKTTLGQHVD